MEEDPLIGKTLAHHEIIELPGKGRMINNPGTTLAQPPSCPKTGVQLSATRPAERCIVKLR